MIKFLCFMKKAKTFKQQIFLLFTKCSELFKKGSNEMENNNTRKFRKSLKRVNTENFKKFVFLKSKLLSIYLNLILINDTGSSVLLK